MRVKGRAARNANSREKNPNRNTHVKLTAISYRTVPMTTEVKKEYLDFEILPKRTPVRAARPVPATWKIVHGPCSPQTAGVCWL